jgi:hypothetical protein
MIAEFLKGIERHPRHGTLAEILARDDSWWESNHDFIQWVFPTDQQSAFNPEAPLIAEMTDPAPALTDARYQRFGRYLMMHSSGHNLLRITRALRHARLIQRGDLQTALYLLARNLNPTAAEETIDYWRSELQSGDSR